jgi:hypothetical protein
MIFAIDRLENTKDVKKRHVKTRSAANEGDASAAVSELAQHPAA